MKFPVLRLKKEAFIKFYQKQNPDDNPKFKKLVVQYRIKKHGLHNSVYLIIYAMGDNGNIMHKNPIELIHEKVDRVKIINQPFNLGNLEFDIPDLIDLIGVYNDLKDFKFLSFDPVPSRLEYVGYDVSNNKELISKAKNPCPPIDCLDKRKDDAE